MTDRASTRLIKSSDFVLSDALESSVSPSTKSATFCAWLMNTATPAMTLRSSSPRISPRCAARSKTSDASKKASVRWSQHATEALSRNVRFSRCCPKSNRPEQTDDKNAVLSAGPSQTVRIIGVVYKILNKGMSLRRIPLRAAFKPTQ